MAGFQAGREETTARFRFPPDFIGFKGHFPGNPVLPGVCKVQAALCMIEKKNHAAFVLQEIVAAKFFHPVTADEELVFTLRDTPEGSQTVLVKILVTRHDTKIADIHLRIGLTAE